jgi:hypothetical protein
VTRVAGKVALERVQRLHLQTPDPVIKLTVAGALLNESAVIGLVINAHPSGGDAPDRGFNPPGRINLGGVVRL